MINWWSGKLRHLFLKLYNFDTFDRHWDKFVPEKKSNIFVVSLTLEDGQYKLAEDPRNLLAGSGLVCEYDL